jgi:hypothetical protein
MSVSAAAITATMGGVRESQIAIGDHILQVNARDGAIVKVSGSRRRPRPKPRASPVLVRPRPFPGFLDRGPETDMAARALDTAATVEVVGEPGIGKTVLLRQLCHAGFTSAFPDGVIYLSAADRPVADILQLVFGHFHEVPGRYRPTDPELSRALLEKRALIVLDDVGLARDEVGVLLDALPRCAVLLAAEARRLWGESRVIHLAGLPEDETVALVEAELGRSLSDDERAAARALCTALDGHPLRILQAAARLEQEGLPPAVTPAAVAPADVSAEQRTVLAVLAAAGGPLDLLALVDLTGNADVDGTMRPLLELRLVEAQSDGYRIAAGAATLTTADGIAAARRELLAYLAKWAEARQDDPGAIAARAPLLVRMLRAALAAGEATDALRLARAVESSLMLAGLWGAWRRAVEACGEAADALPDGATVEAWVLHQIGTMEVLGGDVTAGVTRLEQAIRMREALGDTAGAAATRANLRALRLAPGPWRKTKEWAEAHGGARLVSVMGVAVIGGAALVWQFGFREPLATLSASPTMVDFREQPVGSTTAPRSIRIVNESRVPTRIEAAAIEGSEDFAVATDGCAGVLPALAACTVAAVFNPSATGYRTARLRLLTEQARGFSSVTLAGYGIDSVVTPPPPPPAGRPRIATQDLDFGEREVGSVIIGTGTLGNTGDAAASLGRLELAGDAAFRLVSDRCSGRSLPPGGECQVEIEFQPAAPAALSATLRVTSAAGGDLATLRIRGHGTVSSPPPPPPPPPARILGFGARPDTITVGEEVQLCYALADAVEAEIRPEVGRVRPEPRACVTVRPRQTLTYTLRATGEDGRGEDRNVMVTVTRRPPPPPPPDREPPPPPRRITPGSTNALDAPNLFPCSSVIAQWTPVQDASMPVDYTVVLQRSFRTDEWTDITRHVTRETRLDISGLVRDQNFIRWRVQPRDAAGNEGRSTAWHYFWCQVPIG